MRLSACVLTAWIFKYDFKLEETISKNDPYLYV